MPISAYLKGIRNKVGHELLVQPAASVSVVDDGGKLLLGRDAEKGHWVIPGGAIDPNEEPATAAVREFYEETGFFIEIAGLIGVFGGPDFLIDYPNGDIVSYITLAFRATIVDKRGSGDGELSELAYFSQADCWNLALSKPARHIVKATFANSAQSYFQHSSWKPSDAASSI
jgi:8-oxo-dGTP pyrophosphatase MutT (NUDIX family)